MSFLKQLTKNHIVMLWSAYELQWSTNVLYWSYDLVKMECIGVHWSANKLAWSTKALLRSTFVVPLKKRDGFSRLKLRLFRYGCACVLDRKKKCKKSTKKKCVRFLGITNYVCLPRTGFLKSSASSSKKQSKSSKKMMQ